MTLNNLQIQIKDFKSIRKTEWISLDGKIEVIGRNNIDGGSNGSGKSSILEALYTCVSLCDTNEKAEEKKLLKRFFRDNKHPFEILVRFTVGSDEFQIKATPDGILEGTAEGKQHLYTLITSFLMQGMTNSLIKQEASEVKTVISTYFECDGIIDLIMNNSGEVREQLNRKINVLHENKNDYEKKLSENEVRLEISNGDVERLLIDKEEIQGKEGFNSYVPYDEDKHDEVLTEIEEHRITIKTMDNEIMELYEEKASLASGVDKIIQELKREREKIILTAEGLYIRTIGNKFVSHIKKVTKEYNDKQKREYDERNELAFEEKNRKIAEIQSEIKELEERESIPAHLSNDQRIKIVSRSAKYTELISNKIEIKVVKDETEILFSDLMSIVTTAESESKDQLVKELSSIKKSAVKKFQPVDIKVYTIKNKPKTKLPKYYIVYNWDIDTNEKSIIENQAPILDIDEIDKILQEMENYQAPDTSKFDSKINELESTDAVKREIELDSAISEKQRLKSDSEEQLGMLQDEEKMLSESKINYKQFKEDHRKLLSIEEELSRKKEEIEDFKEAKESYSSEISKTVQLIERWKQFLNDLEKNTRLVKNSFKDFIIDRYNDRLEMLIDFYSKEIYNLNSKLVVKIGSKAKQPSLNGIKFTFTSGGEKSKALFIFSLAHRDYLSKQRGFNNNYIFCDEVFDGMDEISRQQSIQFLTQGLVMENILVISHLEDTTLPNFKTITVTKDDSGTEIRQSLKEAIVG